MATDGLARFRRAWPHFSKLFDRYKFACRVDLITDETKPATQDRFFQVQMTGRIPVPQDQYDTDVRIEIRDITDGRNQWSPILSTDDRYRSGENPVFCFQTSNGIVPHRNAVLAGWALVERIPCHILRFAYRGRRKLLFVVSILSAQTGQVLTADQRTMEYVSYCDGYQELRSRRLAALRSSVELAVAVVSEISEEMTALLTAWLGHRASIFMSQEEAATTVQAIKNQKEQLSVQQSCQPLLAFGDNTDRYGAIELMLRTAGLENRLSRTVFMHLAQTAELLEIPQNRFYAMAQKILLSSGCIVEDPAQLLGLSEEMEERAFLKRINEEYRKWNARVTHSDSRIRHQADQMLTLIARLRSQHFQHCS
ncbi:MAG TPA: hypothetical protein PK052_12715 [Anaerohalosphaeraceae bacterium]|nr:hypothetical protein [Anaerohalosphaeraceae bacterium]HOM77303.1 hypothetical protein [Anaerohalosphaeraceae bacterium]HRS72673.1 hypothetical protein [Anaerohalosphaeraceae bacterium]HRV20017.1 hypothetical protein [Anaerohalosphaeraceae bacterium]